MRSWMALLLLPAGCVTGGPVAPLRISLEWEEGTRFEITREIQWTANPGAFHKEHRVTEPVVFKSRAVLDARVTKVEGFTRLVSLTLREAEITRDEGQEERDFRYTCRDGLEILEMQGEAKQRRGSGKNPWVGVMWADGGVGAWTRSPDWLGTVIGGVDNDPNLLTGFLPSPGERSIDESDEWRGTRSIMIGEYDQVDLELASSHRGWSASAPGTHVIRSRITLAGTTAAHHGEAGRDVGKGDWWIAGDLGKIHGKATFKLLSNDGKVLLEGTDSVRMVRR